MSRPPKDCADYYPLDVGFLQEKKIKLLRSEFGNKCVAVILTIFDGIYGREGYFLKWDKDECLLMSNGVGDGCTPNYIKEVLNGCIRRSLFDKGVFNMFGVITSRGIQRRYLRIFERREEIIMLREYFLLDLSDKKDVPISILKKLTLKSIDSNNNLDKCNINPDKCNNNLDKCNVNATKESKEKKSKVNDKDLSCGGSDEPHEKKIIKTFAKDSVEYLASKYIADKMLEINPNAKTPKTDNDFYKWCIHIDYLLRIDKKDINEMKLVLKFAMKDPFWNTVIHSTKKFREKFDQLFAKMHAKKTVSNDQNKYSKQLESLKEWANE